ncbi:MAG: potassium channel protein [Spirulina sp. SIO3F2]|nr:potassium channel protein [Spirulina sp. SIO3F2]
MQGAFRRILVGAVFFALTLLLAVVGYIWFGWTLLEAVYMVVITIFGVGYGEVNPLETPTQKIFTILVIIAGTSSAVYIVGGFVQMITEGEINRAFAAQLKQRNMENLCDHVVLCGFGRMGQVLARQLTEVGEALVIIDAKGDRAQLAEERGYLARQGNASDEELLEAVGIKRAKALATVLPDDATNVFITLTAKELNPNLTVLARGELTSTEKKLRLAGADHVILPAALSGIRMANLITRPTAVDFLAQQEERNHLNDLLAQIDVQMDELAIAPGSLLAGKTIREIEIRSKGTFIIVALRRASGELRIHPAPSLMLAAGDTLLILGHQSDIPQFARNYELKPQFRYRDTSS